MQAKSKNYLRQFEQENANFVEDTEADAMAWFKRQTISVDLDSKC